MKILLFGKNGQVGWELQRSLGVLGEVLALDRAAASHCGDLANLEGIQRTIESVRPDIVVNAAAYTAVDKAEADIEICHRANALAPEAMAISAQRVGAWLIHYSTDYVFNGCGATPWVETDAVEPLNVYGRTKAEGERRLMQACRRHLVFRTSWVFADRGGNFIKSMLRFGQERERLTIVADQHGAPTGAELIADVTAHAVRQLPGQDAGTLAGIYHLAATGETTWFDYADEVFKLAQARGWPRKAALEPIPTSAYPTPARRPHNSRLNTDKLQHTFGLRFPPWQEGVERAVARLT